MMSLTADAQEVVEVVNLEQDQGLQDRMVDRIIRDDQGYFFMFMLNHIQKYDGRTFSAVDVSAIQREGLQVRDLTMLDKLADGTIVMHSRGVNQLFYISRRSTKVSSAPIRGIPSVDRGRMYLATSISPNKDDANQQIYTATLDGQVTTVLQSDLIVVGPIVQTVSVDSILYLQAEDDKIYRIANGELKRVSKDGKLIARGRDVYVFSREAIYRLRKNQQEKVADLLERSYECRILKQDINGNIIAAYQGRPRFYDRMYVLDNDEVLHDMASIIGVSDVLQDFHTDDAFYRWILGGHNGVQIVNLLRDGSEMIFKKTTTKKGTFGVVVSGVACDESEVVFSREGAGLFSYDKETRQYSELYKEQSERGLLEHNSKLYFHKPSDAYYSHSYRYDGQTDLYKTIPASQTVKQYRVPIKLNDIYVEGINRLIVGGFVSGDETGVIGRYDMDAKSFEVITTTPRQVRSIYYHEANAQYWVGTYSGLLIYSNDFVLLHAIDKSVDESMLSDHVIMCIGYADMILAGTYGGGVYVIDPISYEVTEIISRAEGLTDDAAIGLIADDNGYCWVTTFNGVNVLDKNFDVVRKIYEHDGLPNREFNSKAIAKDGDGDLYAGTLNGVAAFEPDKVMRWEKSHGVDIISIIAYKGQSAEQLPIDDHIDIFSSYDSIQIQYTLPDYYVYPYVQELLDINVQGASFKKHSNRIMIGALTDASCRVDILPKGGVDGASIVFIKKPNNQRSFVILLAVVLIGLLAYLISRSVIHANRAREAEKTAINKKMADLQLTSLQSQMNPHFIFNALGAIQYFIQTQNTDKADEYLSNFAMLMRSILESSKSRYIRLSEELRLLELYMGLEKVRFEELFDYQIDIDPAVDTEINIPPMIIQPFVENAINHGLFNLKGRKGELILSVIQEGPQDIVITVADNGIGREAAAKLRFKKHKSRGMQLVQERLDTLNATSDIHISTETTDLLDEKGVAAGTKVRIVVTGAID